MTRSLFPRVVLGVGGMFFVAVGLWALVAPQNFYDTLATWPPYNEHFLHDVGAFQLGIGATLLTALAWTDSAATVLLGAGLGSAAHTGAHIVDAGDGGAGTDPYLLGAFAVLLLAAAVVRRKEVVRR